MKNSGLVNIAFRISAYSLIIATVLALVILVVLPTESWVFGIVSYILLFITVFVVSYWMIERFLYRKIKLVFKSIATSKSSKEKTRNALRDERDTISLLEEEVSHWQEKQAGEIELLKSQEQFRRDYIGNVSHELKTPIFSIQGYLETLLDGAMEDSEVNRKYLEKAVHAADRLALIVKDLEALNEIESGRLKLNISTFDIHDLCRDVFEMLESTAKEKNILLDFKKSSTTPVYVVADKERIRQVLTNLVENAIKYGKENGSALIGFHPMDENIMIELSDTGIGIEPGNLGKIFERFYRVDKTGARSTGGTGLGLAIVKHLLEAHDQAIHVRSTPGVGTTFTFLLKAAA